jgi:hypothetical protein
MHQGKKFSVSCCFGFVQWYPKPEDLFIMEMMLPVSPGVAATQGFL